MKVRLTRETRVNLPANTIVEVTESEGRRLFAFGLAEAVKKAEKKAKTKAVKE